MNPALKNKMNPALNSMKLKLELNLGVTQVYTRSEPIHSFIHLLPLIQDQVMD